MKTLIILALFFSANLEAKPNKTKPAANKFFYSLPSEASDEWAYAIPECSELTEKEKAALKKCTAFANHESCETAQTAELTNIMNKKKQKFNLIYHVFSSQAACVADKNSALSGEE